MSKESIIYGLFLLIVSAIGYVLRHHTKEVEALKASINKIQVDIAVISTKLDNFFSFLKDRAGDDQC